MTHMQPAKTEATGKEKYITVPIGSSSPYAQSSSRGQKTYESLHQTRERRIQRCIGSTIQNKIAASQKVYPGSVPCNLMCKQMAHWCCSSIDTTSSTQASQNPRIEVLLECSKHSFHVIVSFWEHSDECEQWHRKLPSSANKSFHIGYVADVISLVGVAALKLLAQ